MDTKATENHLVPLGTYVLIWAVLVVLTGVTVGVTWLDLEKWSIFTALLVATVKASLVALFFMHLKYERKIISLIVLVTLATCGVFLILTFTDYPFR